MGIKPELKLKLKIYLQKILVQNQANKPSLNSNKLIINTFPSQKLKNQFKQTKRKPQKLHFNLEFNKNARELKLYHESKKTCSATFTLTKTVTPAQSGTKPLTVLGTGEEFII